MYYVRKVVNYDVLGLESGGWRRTYIQPQVVYLVMTHQLIYLCSCWERWLKELDDCCIHM
jgi:hypothetical protein